MKKRFIFILSIFIMVLILCSCSMDSSGIITKISDEVEYTKIENTVTSVYEKVSKGCVGLAVSGPEGQATGSGVIYKYDEEKSLYYVVTNAHVVRDMTSCKVYMGGTKYNSATIVGYDVKNDIGVVTFSLDFMNQNMKNNLYVVDFFNYEDNDLPVVGQTVLAIGCPLGLDNFNSLTTGVVSSVSKLQIGTDAAINPGNSGGGLFNLEGRLIGINTEKDIWSFSKEYSSKSDYYITSEDVAVEGRGFAMSLNTVKKSIESIIKKNGIVERPTLGVTIKTVNLVLNPNTEYKNYLPADDKFIYFIITGYDTDSKSTAAKDAGIRVNDVIVKVNDEEISHILDLQSILYDMTTDETLKLTIYRLEFGKPVIKDIVISFK